MIDETRFQRVESKLDELKDDVTELKSDFRIHINLVEEHVAGDKKIINQITPILDKLPSIMEIVEDYQFSKVLKQKRMDHIKEVTTKLGLVGLVLGIVVSVIKIL